MKRFATVWTTVVALAVGLPACGGDDRERDSDAGRPDTTDTTETKPKAAEKRDRGPGSDGHGGY